jgi:histidinol-phosphatase (PHP family)
MKIYDQHVHTHFSFDCSESIENYLNNTEHPFTICDHLEFANVETEVDDTVDYDAFSKEVDEISTKYNRVIYKGIEIGYSKGNADKIKEYMSGKHFDCVTLSLHSNGTLDYMSDEIMYENVTAVIEEYFELLTEAVDELDGINTLAHFDYGLRRFTLPMRSIQLLSEDKMIPLFRKMIEKNIALEINAKSIFRLGNKNFYDYAIPLYQALGGKLFTLGSEAHKAQDIELAYDTTIELCALHNIHEIAHFQNGQPVMIAI